METRIIGSGAPLISFVSLLHGTEIGGAKALELISEVPYGTLQLIKANMEAMVAGKRFLDVDLNRCFPGKSGGVHEEVLAKELLDAIRDSNIVVDIHTTTANTESFIVVTKLNPLVERLIAAIPLRKVVRMLPCIASGKALIDHVDAGVSIEFSDKVDQVLMKDILFQTMLNLLEIRSVKKDYYEVYGVETEDIQADNFKLLEKDGESYYPILHGEKEYPMTCMKGKRWARGDFQSV